MARASEQPAEADGPGGGLDRRGFLAATLGAAAAWAWGLGWGTPARAAAGASGAGTLPAATLELLETSKLVYISPLRSDGAESTCHAELWFGWLDGGVVINTRRGTWKAQALGRGLDRARIWVGDHGRWKTGLFERSEAFRSAPHFDARARLETDKAVLERLIALYQTKYGSDFARWREDMQTGFYSGERLLIRYEPL
jgi:hypothetical protein